MQFVPHAGGVHSGDYKFFTIKKIIQGQMVGKSPLLQPPTGGAKVITDQ